jgi:glycosyltransferase involved in cell wall biosynthesis
VKPAPTVSVIIPTYNRKDVLRDALNSLAQQTYPKEGCEIIIVDDGSTDGTDEIAAQAMPFAVRYVRQENQGDAVARNTGALQSQADILVFLDDDMLLEPNYLNYLINAQDMSPKRIVVGTWDLWQAGATPFTQSVNTSLPTGAYYAQPQFAQDPGIYSDQLHTLIGMPFRDAYSNNMALKREAYAEIGMMQSLEYSGSSMWCDLDFAYRAYQKGFEFHRSAKVICWHRDHSADNLKAYSQRMRTAAYRAVQLFRKYPELITHIPMFHDKTPIIWGQDPPRLIARKLVRTLASSRPALWCMNQVAVRLEKADSGSSVLPALYRYIIAGSIFRGYREGLRAASGR